MDSHQRLSDVADNTVCNRQVISSNANQIDNGQAISNGCNTGSGASSNAAAAEYSAFNYNLGAGVSLHEEEFQSIVVTGAQSAGVEGVARTQNDAVASAELSGSSSGTDCVISTGCQAYFVCEVERLFNSRRCVNTSDSYSFNSGVSTVESIDGIGSFNCSIIQRFVSVSDGLSSYNISISNLCFSYQHISSSFRNYSVNIGLSFNRASDSVSRAFDSNSIDCTDGDKSLISNIGVKRIFCNRSCFDGISVSSVFSNGSFESAVESASFECDINCITPCSVSNYVICVNTSGSFSRASVSQQRGSSSSICIQTTDSRTFSYYCSGAGFSSCFCSNSGYILITLSFFSCGQGCVGSFNSCVSSGCTSNQDSSVFIATSRVSDGKTSKSSVVSDRGNFCRVQRASDNVVCLGSSSVNTSSFVRGSNFRDQRINSSGVSSLACSFCSLGSSQSVDQASSWNQTGQSAVRDSSDCSINRSNRTVHANQYGSSSNRAVRGASSVSDS